MTSPSARGWTFSSCLAHWKVWRPGLTGHYPCWEDVKGSMKVLEIRGWKFSSRSPPKGKNEMRQDPCLLKMESMRGVCALF